MEDTRYGLKVSLPVPYDEAIVRATDALKAQGFGVLTTIDVKQTLKALKDLAESDAEKYLAFYKEYGRVLKEGIAIDWKNMEAIAATTLDEGLVS